MTIGAPAGVAEATEDEDVLTGLALGMSSEVPCEWEAVTGRTPSWCQGVGTWTMVCRCTQCGQTKRLTLCDNCKKYVAPILRFGINFAFCLFKSWCNHRGFNLKITWIKV